MMSFVAVALLGLAIGCSKDDDNSNNGGSSQQGDIHNYSAKLIGDWRITAMSLDGQQQQVPENMLISFYAGGEGLFNDNGETEHNDFGWVINGDKISITTRGESGHGRTMEFTIASFTDTQCTFSGSNVELPGMGDIQGVATMTITKILN